MKHHCKKIEQNPLKNFFYNNSLEIYFASLLFMIFGSLLSCEEFYQNHLLPFTGILNFTSGILIIKKHTKPLFAIAIFMVLINLIFAFIDFSRFSFMIKQITIFSLTFAFTIVATKSIIRQVMGAKEVNKSVILGMMCGYISLGLIAFYLVIGLELIFPGSFTSSVHNFGEAHAKAASLLYYSFITLLTIGYGEIIPVTAAAQKVSIMIGLMGQFYMVILMGIIVGKYVNQKHSK